MKKPKHFFVIAFGPQMLMSDVLNEKKILIHRFLQY